MTEDLNQYADTFVEDEGEVSEEETKKVLKKYKAKLKNQKKREPEIPSGPYMGGTFLELEQDPEEQKMVGKNIADLALRAAETPPTALASLIDEGSEGMGDFLVEQFTTPLFTEEGTVDMSPIEDAPSMKEAMVNLGLSEEGIIGKEGYPEAINPSPAALAAFAGEILNPIEFGGVLAARKAFKYSSKAGKLLAKRYGRKQAQNVVEQMGKRIDLRKKGFDPTSISRQIYQDDARRLLKYTQNPKKLLNELGGKPIIKTEVTQTGKQAFKKVGTTKTGLIDEITMENDALITEWARQNTHPPITRKDIVDKVIDKYVKEASDPASGLPRLSEDEIKALKTNIEKLIVKTDSGDKFQFFIEEMQELKRNLGKPLKYEDFAALPQEVQNLQKDIRRRLNVELDNTIKEILNSAPVDFGGVNITAAGFEYGVNNRRIKNLMNFKEIVEDVLKSDMKDSFDFTKALVASAFGGAIGAGAGSIMGWGALKTAIYVAGLPLAFKGLRGALKSTPHVATRGAKIAEGLGATMEEFFGSNLGKATMHSILPVTRGFLREDKGLIRNDSQGRVPQSINPIVDDQELRRDSQWIMNHPKLVQSKILRESPELAMQVATVIEKGDLNRLKKIMPVIAEQLPHIFEEDEYGEFDGKIINQANKNAFIENIMENPDLDSTEKAEIIDHLNRTNEVLR